MKNKLYIPEQIQGNVPSLKAYNYTKMIAHSDGFAFNHACDIADFVEMNSGTDDMIAASYLHHVVEEGFMTLQHIELFFNKEIKELLYWVSDPTKLEYIEDRFKERNLREHYATAPPIAKIIKASDLIFHLREDYLNQTPSLNIKKYEVISDAMLEELDKFYVDRINELLIQNYNQIIDKKTY